jgi:hypothetical protein
MAAAASGAGEGPLIEVSHADWVSLETVGAHQVIVRHGVGERQRISFQAELAFVDGVGMLAPSTGTVAIEPLWVNDVLNKSTHVQDVGRGQSEFILYDKELQKKSVYRSSVMGKHSVGTLSLPGPPAFSGELYAFQLSPNGGLWPQVFSSVCPMSRTFSSAHPRTTSGSARVCTYGLL